MATLIRIDNGPAPTTAALVKVTTGATIKTMLQVLHPTLPLDVVEWGISFDGSAAATPIEVELITTNAVAATVTASAAADITAFNAFTDTNFASGLTLSTAGTGYSASGEGSITVGVRAGDRQLVAPTNQYLKQFPLGQEFHVPAAVVLRIRVTAAVAVNAYCYVVVALGGS